MLQFFKKTPVEDVLPKEDVDNPVEAEEAREAQKNEASPQPERHLLGQTDRQTPIHMTPALWVPSSLPCS
ncbi:hypothetical protein E2C01_023937 [Portunus trituberculatus]|uniref:Uncharacterized protein n=1 Tax=Portunus trituberculatus TaxID=210409 RepID=A0A5B7EBD5_PORTR|nr:hypothetical protein [Portunus trituberculatus]